MGKKCLNILAQRLYLSTFSGLWLEAFKENNAKKKKKTPLYMLDIFFLMSEGLVTPKRTTARFLPGSPRERYKAELAMGKKKEEPEKPTEEQEEKKDEEDKEDGEQEDGDQEAEEPKETAPSAGLKRPAAVAFPKGKAKAKGKSKAKAKGKGKAKSAPKAKGKAKADKKEEKAKTKSKEKTEKSGLKKPAAAVKKGQKGPTFKEHLQKIGEGVTVEQQEQEENEEEEEKEDDPTVDEEEEKRSKLKSMKFARMMKLGQVPQNVQDMWKKCDTRSKKTKLLNRLFEKNTRTNQWEMRVDKPEFVAWLKSQDMHFGEASTQSYPRSIMLHTYFHGNQLAMDEALAAGEICEVQQGSRTFYSFDMMAEGHRKSKESNMELSRGRMKLSKEEHGELEDIVQGFDWKAIGSGSPALNQSFSSGGGQKTLALKDQPKLLKWDSIEKHLQDAKGATDRLTKDLSKCFSGVQSGKRDNPQLVENFKELHMQLQKNSQKLQDSLMWKDSEGFHREMSLEIGGKLFESYLLKVCFKVILTR